jgi:precorrin-4/cobalt-precorrin-4 C11-methyltransferase
MRNGGGAAPLPKFGQRETTSAHNAVVPLDQILTFGETARPPLPIQLSLHTLDDIVRELVPFFGEDCPIRLVYTDSLPHAPYSTEVVQATLATIQSISNYNPYTGSPFIVVG